MLIVHTWPIEVLNFKCALMFGRKKDVYRWELTDKEICREFKVVFTIISGLTCTEQNFITKAGAQKIAAEKGIILVAPDTSPSKSLDSSLSKYI